MSSSRQIGLLKKVVLVDNALLQAWTAVEQIFANISSGTATMYKEYWAIGKSI